MVFKIVKYYIIYLLCDFVLCLSALYLFFSN